MGSSICYVCRRSRARQVLEDVLRDREVERLREWRSQISNAGYEADQF